MKWHSIATFLLLFGTPVASQQSTAEPEAQRDATQTLQTSYSSSSIHQSPNREFFQNSDLNQDRSSTLPAKSIDPGATEISGPALDMGDTSHSSGALLRRFVARVLDQQEECAAHLVFGGGFQEDAVDITRHLFTHGSNFQVSSVSAYSNTTSHPASVQAGACRVFILFLSSEEELDHLHKIKYLVGNVWDHRGHFFIVSSLPEELVTVRAVAGLFENLPYFHVARTLGAPARRVALWLYSGFDLSLHYKGSWKSGRGTLDLMPPPADFLGRPLRYVSFEHEPSNIYIDGKLEGRHVGMDFWIAEVFAQVYNFTLEMAEPSDGGKWGEALPNGTWIGLVGDIKERRAHFGIANIFLTLSRWKTIDYSLPYDHEQACFIVWNPPPAPHWLAVTRPFSSNSWVLIFVSFLVSVLAAVFIARRVGGERNALARAPRAALYMFGVLVARSEKLQPERAASQLFDASWRIATMVVGIAYCAKLISVLTFPSTPSPINTHRQLAETGVEVGSWGSTLGDMMAQSSSRWDRLLASRYVPNYDFTDALRRVHSRQYGYIENRHTLIYYIQKYYTTKTGEKQLHIMEECFQNFMISVALSKYSMLTDLFSRTILYVRQAGLVPIWFSWSLEAVKKEMVDVLEAEESSSTKRALTLEHMQGVFLLLSLGLGLSLLAFVAEILTGGAPQRNPRGVFWSRKNLKSNATTSSQQ